MRDHKTVVLAMAKEVMEDNNDIILNHPQTTKEVNKKGEANVKVINKDNDNNNIKTINDITNDKRTREVNHIRANRVKNITKDHDTIIPAKAKNVMKGHRDVIRKPRAEKTKRENF